MPFLDTINDFARRVIYTQEEREHRQDVYDTCQTVKTCVIVAAIATIFFALPFTPLGFVFSAAVLTLLHDAYIGADKVGKLANNVYYDTFHGRNPESTRDFICKDMWILSGFIRSRLQ